MERGIIRLSDVREEVNEVFNHFNSISYDDIESKNLFESIKGFASEIYDLLSFLERKHDLIFVDGKNSLDRLSFTLNSFMRTLRRFNNTKTTNSIYAIQELAQAFETLENELIYAVKILNNKIEKRGEDKEIEAINIRIKEIYYEVSATYEKLKGDIDKATLLTNKLEELEERQRKLISRLNINNDAYKEKISVVDVAYEKVEDFTKKISSYNNASDNFKAEIVKLDASYNVLSNKFISLDQTLSEKQQKLDTILTQAESVLGKASTAALGQFFKEQYEHSKQFLWIWPLMGFAFLSGAILICVITVFPGLINTGPSKDILPGIDETAFIISRLVVSPLFLVGAWFCATQYVKRKNIIEDYGYKKVLSLSLLSFKAEIEKTGVQNTTEFIRAVQNELIKSPLDSLDRKHLKRESDFLKNLQSEVMSGMLKNVSSAFERDKDKTLNKEKQ
ncbi:putative nuclease with TOPRIM domain [Pantoea agglomerans]|jgi:hypothetical protein|uniref:hypothetical protein n=1 Tax=Enterobacter agglomerans TaxID=549 RepID=UPI00277E70D2|nr:hypothetical protein [Pantoea agglomerans]MDQ0432652.1 putative nuclease with TOPRIM domain [Pantoea agglomerans]